MCLSVCVCSPAPRLYDFHSTFNLSTHDPMLTHQPETADSQNNPQTKSPNIVHRSFNSTGSREAHGTWYKNWLLKRSPSCVTSATSVPPPPVSLCTWPLGFDEFLHRSLLGQPAPSHQGCTIRRPQMPPLPPRTSSASVGIGPGEIRLGAVWDSG